MHPSACFARLALVTVTTLSSVAALAMSDASPLRIVKGADALTLSDATGVLYHHGDASVVREPGAQPADFEDVYVVNTYNSFAAPTVLDSQGELLAFDPGNFAVVRASPSEAEAIVAGLHGQGLSCGILTKLDGSPITELVAAAPTPLLPLDGRDARVQSLTDAVDADRVKATIDLLTGMSTRYHKSTSGRGVAEQLADLYRALAGDRADVTVTTYDHGSATPQQSLLVRITGASRPDEVLVLGSHIDSINMPWSFLNPSAAAPGADDNASGTATNLEIFRLLMAGDVRLERTLEIHGYAAEEIGLVGSADMASDYKDQGTNVLAMVQFDMTAYKAGGAVDQIWFISDDTDATFNGDLAKLVAHYTGLPTGVGSLPQGSSDHASWRRHGFATAFPFENPTAHNGHIHTGDDSVANAAAFSQAAGFTKLGLAFALHYGGID